MSKPVYEITEQLLSEIEADGGKNYNGLTLSLVAEIRRLQGGTPTAETPAAPEKPAAKAKPVKLDDKQRWLLEQTAKTTVVYPRTDTENTVLKGMEKRGLIYGSKRIGYRITEKGANALDLTMTQVELNHARKSADGAWVAATQTYLNVERRAEAMSWLMHYEAEVIRLEMFSK